MAKKLLIELPYLGNLAFYNLLTNYDIILIEKHESFEKASFRNRCEITGPNGKLVLSIPIVGGKHKKQLYKDAKICYDHTWLKDHWNSFTSAYRRSPYFEYYEDRFEAVYRQELAGLYELNWALFELIVSLLKWDKDIQFTESYQKNHDENVADYRNYFLPRKHQEATIKYMQVFEDRTGFVNNLSIVDLLFNEGPNAANLLKTM